MIDDYDAAVAYLERLVATPVQPAQAVGLGRVGLLLERLDHPQNRFTTVHITGSSGKGSTATMAAAMLRAAGLRVGLFTSPRLEEYTERIVVDGEEIPREEWTRLLNVLHPLIERMAANDLAGYSLGRPAFMEVLWAMAALHFAASAVDVAVVEVGMGGRYDATNYNNARVGVITNVSLEHTDRLGSTVAEIAYQKAGIAKRDGIVVTAASDPAALQVIARECAAQGAATWRVTEGGDGAVRYSGAAHALHVETPLHVYSALRLSLLGDYQRTNAACAVAALDALATAGSDWVGEEAVRMGLAHVRMPGRLEWAGGDPPTILDGAHNPDAARALAAALRVLLPAEQPVFLLGILADKDYRAMVDALAPLASAIVVTEPPWRRRVGNGPEIMRAARQYLEAAAFIPDVPAALVQAQQEARARHVALVVTGSLILVGAVRPLVMSH